MIGNGLIFWTEREIAIRRMIKNHFVKVMDESLRELNRAFHMMQVEAPLLTPADLGQRKLSMSLMTMTTRFGGR